LSATASPDRAAAAAHRSLRDLAPEAAVPRLLSEALGFPDAAWLPGFAERLRASGVPRGRVLAAALLGEGAAALRDEHVRLFGSAGVCRPDLGPYLAPRRDFDQMQRIAEMAGFYRAFGLGVEGRRPDDAAVVLEFLAYLRFKARYAAAMGWAEREAVTLRAERDFVRGFARPGLLGFARDLAERARGRFYPVLAASLRRAVRRPWWALGPLARLASVVLAVAASPSSAAEVIVAAAEVSRAPEDPADPAWDQARPATVPLMAQALVAPYGGEARTLEVRAAHDAIRLAFRLAWADAGADETWDISGRFADGCAVQVPARAGEMPAPLMGHRGGFVSILRWRALDPAAEPYPKAYADYHRPDAIEVAMPSPVARAERLIAQGYGTLDRVETGEVRAKGAYARGSWTVVLSAPKRSFLPAAATAARSSSGPVPVAFAVWDGGKGERDGMKSVSVWHWLALDGAPPARSEDPVERGRVVFARYGCAACHGEGGRGGVPNPNAQGGLVPPIHRVAEGYSDEELKEVIRKGRNPVPVDDAAPPPPLRMNAWGTVMGEDELDDLVAYLKSLMPAAAPGEEW
jgi:mono/diheme cytochrome c family protein